MDDMSFLDQIKTVVKEDQFNPSIIFQLFISAYTSLLWTSGVQEVTSQLCYDEVRLTIFNES